MPGDDTLSFPVEYHNMFKTELLGLRNTGQVGRWRNVLSLGQRIQGPKAVSVNF